MAVKVIRLKGESVAFIGEGKNKVEKPIFYDYNKIVTPATKRNRGTEQEQKDATFFTFAEITKHLGGRVEFPLIKEVVDGKETGKMILDENAPTSICQYIMDGVNLEYNQQAKDAATNTPEVKLARTLVQLTEMRANAVKQDLDPAGVDMMIEECKAKIKALKDAEEAATKSKEETDKKEASETRASRSPKK